MPRGIYPRNSKKKEKKEKKQSQQLHKIAVKIPQPSRLLTRQLRASLVKEEKAAKEAQQRMQLGEMQEVNNYLVQASGASPDPCNELRRELFQASQTIKKQDQKIEALCQTVFNLARIVGGEY